MFPDILILIMLKHQDTNTHHQGHIVKDSEDRRKLQKKADEITQEEGEKFTPWMVTMPIERDSLKLAIYETVYYVRAPDPFMAGMFASKLFAAWEGEEFMPFPSVNDSEGLAEKLTERQYKSCWAEAQKKDNQYHDKKEKQKL